LATSFSWKPRAVICPGLFYVTWGGFYKMNPAIPNPADWLPSCTVRIEAERDGKTIGIGTGFLYDFELKPKPGDNFDKTPTIITNKHVVEGADFVKVSISVARPDAETDSMGLPVGRFHPPARVALGQHLINHPNAAIDLCAIPAAWLFARVEAAGEFQVINRRLWRGHRVPADQRGHIRYIEPIAMVGYPSGLWDSANNAPIVRRGSTATHPLVHYEGRPEFLIDAACFPGSSGSPIFLFQDGIYYEQGVPHHGIRTYLLGILYAGPQFTATGKLEPKPIPNGMVEVPVTSFPMNLGYVINADELDVLQPLVQQRYEASEPLSEEALRVLRRDA